jgi:hypothetical protein
MSSSQRIRSHHRTAPVTAVARPSPCPYCSSSSPSRRGRSHHHRRAAPAPVRRRRHAPITHRARADNIIEIWSPQLCHPARWRFRHSHPPRRYALNANPHRSKPPWSRAGDTSRRRRRRRCQRSRSQRHHDYRVWCLSTAFVLLRPPNAYRSTRTHGR